MAASSRPSLDELAAAEIDDDDLEVLRTVARGYDEVDPVPSGLVDRIRFGITLDALHADIAQLQRGDELAGVRGERTDAHTVTFTSDRLTTMVTITAVSPGRVRIDGWIAPGGGVDVELRRPDGSHHTVADADGRFVLEAIATGLGQFVLRPPGGAPVYTPSIEI